MAQLVQQIGGHQWNVREMVLNAGIGQYLAQMAIPYMYFLPRTCDPYAQGTQAIVQGLQNMLAARGHRVPVDGWMGRATMDATRVYAGPRWMDKSWVQIYGDVMAGKVVARPPQARLPATAPTATGDVLDPVIDLASNPLAWLAGGAAVYFLVGRKRS